MTPEDRAKLDGIHASAHYARQHRALITEMLAGPLYVLDNPNPITLPRAVELLARAESSEDEARRQPIDANGWPVIDWSRA